LKIKSIRYTKKSRKSPESPKAIRKGSTKKFGQFAKNWGKTIKVVSKFGQTHLKIGFLSTGPLRRLCLKKRVNNLTNFRNLSITKRRSLSKILETVNISINSTKFMPLTLNVMKLSAAKSISMLSMGKMSFLSTCLIC
jgi:hypothetical protein